MIIVLEGIDGSGKTTAAQLLCRKLEGQFPAVEYWSKSSAEFEEPFVRRHALSLRELIWPPAGDKPASDVLGTHYYMFLIAAWFSVVERHRLRRIREGDTLAVFDGWFYRNIAKAFVREKLDKDWMRTLFDGVGAPDLVVLLDVEPAVAWGRRSQYTLDEVGRWDGFGGDAFDSFCAYQQLVRGELLEFAEKYGWAVIRQTADTSVEEVVAEISDRVLSRRPPSRAAGGDVMQRTETHSMEGNLKLRIMHYPRPSAPAEMCAAAEEYERRFGIRFDTLTYFSKALLEELHRLDEGAEVPRNITIASRTDKSILENMATLTRIANGGTLTTAERADYFLALKRIYGKLPARLGEVSRDRDTLFVGIEREGRILAESMNLLPANHNLHPNAKRIPYLHGLLVGVSEFPQPRTYSQCIIIDGAIASGATIISVIEKLRGACSSFSIYSAHSSLEGLLGIARYGDASGLDVSVTVGHATVGMNAKFYAVDPADRSKVVIGDIGDTISNLES